MRNFAVVCSLAFFFTACDGPEECAFEEFFDAVSASDCWQNPGLSFDAYSKQVGDGYVLAMVGKEPGSGADVCLLYYVIELEIFYLTPDLAACGVGTLAPESVLNDPEIIEILSSENPCDGAWETVGRPEADGA